MIVPHENTCRSGERLPSSCEIRMIFVRDRDLPFAAAWPMTVETGA
jgi:hypothetical protein